MTNGTTPGSDHRGNADWGGLVALIVVLVAPTAVLIYRSSRVVNSGPNGGSLLLVLIVGIIAFVWVLFAFYWARGRLRSNAVRRMLPDAVLFEVVMTDGLAAEIRLVQDASHGRPPRIYPQTYLTVAVTVEGIRFFGGSFRPVSRGEVVVGRLTGVTIQVVDLPTRTVTRHFPTMVVQTTLGQLTLEMLPMRTTFLIPRQLAPAQLDAASRAVAQKLGVPFS